MLERDLNPPEFYYKPDRSGYCDKCCEFDELKEVERDYWLCFECREEAWLNLHNKSNKEE